MTDYPKQDHEINLLTTDNVRISGLINVLGRSISNYLQGTEPDIVMYQCMINGSQNARTLILSKNHSLWVHTGEKPLTDRIGNWQTLNFRMINGDIIKGDVNMTGYDRVSDYLQNFNERYYEVYYAESKGDCFDMLYLSRLATVWKEPAN
ncbi:MAG: hypothetical protein KKD44_16375 [Proteobacteria bacterium]|nr:hypothetical protein [Pseudomonadota bacterium]